MDAYLKEAAQLPVPTEEQTERFAERLPVDHDWYKRLPLIPPGALFVFYLASEVATDYRDRFGYWSYWYYDCWNPHKLPQISASNGTMLVLPDELTEKCSCRLTTLFARSFVPHGSILPMGEKRYADTLEWCAAQKAQARQLLQQAEAGPENGEMRLFLPVFRTILEMPDGPREEIMRFLKTSKIGSEFIKIHKERQAIEGSLLRSTLQKARQYFADNARAHHS